MKVNEMKCCVCGNQAVCTVEEKPYCNKHYQSMRSYGTPFGKRRERTCRYSVDGDDLKVITPKGQVIFADIQDWDIITKYSWCISKTGYAVANIHGKVTKMHRYIIGEDNCTGMVVDHINRDKLDNRRANLRVCSRAENQRNVTVSKTNKLGHLGIRMTKAGKFNVRIVADGVEHHIGNFETLELAITARNEAENKYHGDFASHKDKEGTR